MPLRMLRMRAHCCSRAVPDEEKAGQVERREEKQRQEAERARKAAAVKQVERERSGRERMLTEQAAPGPVSWILRRRPESKPL